MSSMPPVARWALARDRTAPSRPIIAAASSHEGRTKMSPDRQMHLGVYAVGTGNHVSGWRVPGAATSSEDFSIFKTIADSCERGKLDFLFVGDSLAFVADRHPGQMLRFEP